MQVTFERAPVPDLFKVGNVVIHKDSSFVVLVTDRDGGKAGCFRGIAFYNIQQPEFDSCWDKSQFVQFNGTVNITV